MLRRCARGAVPSLCRWVTSTTWQPGSTASRPWTSSRSLEAIPLRSRSTGSRAASVFTDVWTPDAGARASSRKEKSHSRDDARISRDAPSRTRDRLAPRQEFERDLRLARDVFDALEAGDRHFHRTGAPLTVAQASLVADRVAHLCPSWPAAPAAAPRNRTNHPNVPFPPSTPPLPENPERVAFRERLVADPRFVAMLDRATSTTPDAKPGAVARLARLLGATLTRCGCVLPAEAWRAMCEGARAKAGEMSAEEVARVVWALGSAARGNRDAFLLSTTGETTSALESAMARVARDMTRARARDTLVHYLRIVEAGAAFGGACEGAIAALSERVTRADEPFEPVDAASRLVGVMRAHIMLRDAGRSHEPSPELAMRTVRLLARREMRGARRSNAHGVVLVAAEFVEAIGARGALAGGNAAARELMHDIDRALRGRRRAKPSAAAVSDASEP